MKKSEFSQLVRDIIKEELSKNIGLRNFLKETIKKELNKLLVEAESKVAEDSISREAVDTRHGIQLKKMVSKTHKQPIYENELQSTEKSFVKNPMLNKLLNETAYDLQTGKATLPSANGGSVNPAEVMKQLNENSDWNKELRFDSSHARGFSGKMPDQAVKSVGSMMPTKDVAGNPMVVNPNTLPDHIQTALTKDYSKFMKKVDEKTSRKRG